ncbi:MAG: D-Ala-D-Ala carboxypeptidase family metallohydrolase [Bacteroidota bacterium]
MQLSKNFSLEELTTSSTHLPNVPSSADIVRLTALVNHVLQPLRDLYAKPIKINSAFRSIIVNKAVGGAATSQHLKGEAADLEGDDNAHLFRLISEHFPFDQLIWEGGNDQQPDWVHVSYKEKDNRKEMLRMKIVKGKKRYEIIS